MNLELEAISHRESSGRARGSLVASRLASWESETRGPAALSFVPGWRSLMQTHTPEHQLLTDRAQALVIAARCIVTRQEPAVIPFYGLADG